MNSIVANIRCYSQQGRARQSNRDFVGVFELKRGLLVYLLDISTSSALNGINFVERLNCLLSERLTQYVVTDNNRFLEVFKQIILDLQQTFKSGSASLITCFISYESNTIWGYTAGDPRLGVMDEQITWVSPVHTGANPFDKSFTDNMKLLPERHILTRSVNMQKKYNPEFFQLELSKEQSLVIGTDGFWAELTPVQQQQVLTGQYVPTEDDCSIFTIQNFLGAVNSHCSDLPENCFYFNVTNKA